MPRTTTKRKYRQKSKTRAKRAGTKRKRVTRRAKSRTRRVKKTTKKVIAKRKRRVKLINKTIKRVQTKLADEVVTMRRMRPLPRVDIVGGYNHPTNLEDPNNVDADTNVDQLDIRANAVDYYHVDGQLVLNKYVITNFQFYNTRHCCIKLMCMYAPGACVGRTCVCMYIYFNCYFNKKKFNLF